MAFLPEERRKKILEILNENGSVTIEAKVVGGAATASESAK